MAFTGSIRNSRISEALSSSPQFPIQTRSPRASAARRQAQIAVAIAACGDFSRLDQKVNGSADNGHVHQYLAKYATNFKRFRTASGLSDYGGLNNLLECVNTYLHEVASLNAANVYNLRFAAELAELAHRATR